MLSEEAESKSPLYDQVAKLPWASGLSIVRAILRERQEFLVKKAFPGAARKCRLCGDQASRRKLTAHGGHRGHCPLVRLNTVIRSVDELRSTVRGVDE